MLTIKAVRVSARLLRLRSDELAIGNLGWSVTPEERIRKSCLDPATETLLASWLRESVPAFRDQVVDVEVLSCFIAKE